MANTKKGVGDKALFREMNQPFADMAEANAALVAFQADLAELRKKHKIPTLVAACQISWVIPEGEADAIMPMVWGDSLRWESVAAWLHAHEQANHTRLIAEAMAHAKAVAG